MPARNASKSPFPYGAPGKVAYFFVTADRAVEPLRSADAVVLAIDTGATIFAAWPGKSRTDLFLIDEPVLLREALINDTVGTVPTIT